MSDLKKSEEQIDETIRRQTERLKKKKSSSYLPPPPQETELYDTGKGPFMDIQERKKK